MLLSGAVGPGFRFCGAMLSLLRLPDIRPKHVENSRNHALSVVATLISPMLFIVGGKGFGAAKTCSAQRTPSYLFAETISRARI
jgi:hypothetical protein